MEVSYVEGIANHNGPESCGAAREGGVEALTGERTGRVLSREIHALLRKQQVLRDADAVEVVGRQHRVHRHRKGYQGPARSETPCMYASTLCGQPIWPLRRMLQQASMARRGSTTARPSRRTFRTSPLDSSEERTEPGPCVGFTSRKWVNRVSFAHSGFPRWRIRSSSVPRSRC